MLFNLILFHLISFQSDFFFYWTLCKTLKCFTWILDFLKVLHSFSSLLSHFPSELFVVWSQLVFNAFQYSDFILNTFMFRLRGQGNDIFRTICTTFTVMRYSLKHFFTVCICKHLPNLLCKKKTMSGLHLSIRMSVICKLCWRITKKAIKRL